MTNQRYIDLTYIVAENEEEEEQRDYSVVAKQTKAAINHSSYSCIGSQTCHKQKTIRKLFPLTLKQCEELNKVNIAAMAKTQANKGTLEDKNNSFASLTSNKFGSIADNNHDTVSGNLSRPKGHSDGSMPLIGSPVKSIPLMRKTGEAGVLEDRSIADFMKHLDVLECQRSSK